MTQLSLSYNLYFTTYKKPVKESKKYNSQDLQVTPLLNKLFKQFLINNLGEIK